MNPTERDTRDTDPAPPPGDTDIICSSCSIKLELDELDVRHPEPHCEGWRHKHAAGIERGAIK